MRGCLCGLLMVALLLLGSGCIVASSTTWSSYGKGIAVIDDTIYVVDLNKKTAYKAAIVQPADVEIVEIVTVESDSEPQAESNTPDDSAASQD